MSSLTTKRYLPTRIVAYLGACFVVGSGGTEMHAVRAGGAGKGREGKGSKDQPKSKASCIGLAVVLHSAESVRHECVSKNNQENQARILPTFRDGTLVWKSDGIPYALFAAMGYYWSGRVLSYSYVACLHGLVYVNTIFRSSGSRRWTQQHLHTSYRLSWTG